MLLAEITWAFRMILLVIGHRNVNIIISVSISLADSLALKWSELAPITQFNKSTEGNIHWLITVALASL